MRTLLALIALALAAPAGAADPPGTFGMAQRGSFKLVAGIILNDRGGEMKGVWIDAKQGCRARRTLQVSFAIDLVNDAGKTTRVKRTRRGAVDNCAEGGPTSASTSHPASLASGALAGDGSPAATR